MRARPAPARAKKTARTGKPRRGFGPACFFQSSWPLLSLAGRKGISMKSMILAALIVSQAAAASLSCINSAVPTVIRTEGLAERLGDIVLNCSQGAPAGTVSGNLIVFLPANVTNKLSASGTLDAILTIDTGSGPVSAGVSPVLQSANALAFNGLNFTLSPAGTVSMRISNLRLNANQLGATLQQQVQVFLALNGPTGFTIDNNPITAGITTRALLAAQSSTRVTCTRSAIPSVISFSSLIGSATRFVSTRVTEGSAGAFQVKDALSDSGVRIMVRYTNFPPKSRILVPDVVVGSTGVRPTAGGDLGVAASGGIYAPGGNGSLLLSRVIGADANGAGGTPVFVPGPAGSGQVAFDNVNDVDLANGAGVAVYEVVDSDPTRLESAQFPSFLGLPAITDGSIPPTASIDVSLAPTSTVATAASAPVPRFSPVAPPQDCASLGDCGASYFPRLLVDAGAQPLEFTAASGSGNQLRYIRIVNDGGGVMNWTATIAYKNGSGWILLDTPSDNVNRTMRLDVLPQKLQPGVYEATVTIDAGPIAGAKVLPVKLTVTQAAPPPPPAVQPPAVESVTNAASFLPGGVVAGSLATIKGSKLGGKVVSVTFDGIPARLLYTSDTQINLMVPAELGSRPSAQVVVTVDGVSAAAMTVQLAVTAPSIFANGVLNQDYSANAPDVPAQVGSIVQIFLTGLNLPEGWSPMVRLHDREIESLFYAGPAPGIPGVQQVDVQVPDDLPAMTTEVKVCATSSASRICSAPAKITLRQ